MNRFRFWKSKAAGKPKAAFVPLPDPVQTMFVSPDKALPGAFPIFPTIPASGATTLCLMPADQVVPVAATLSVQKIERLSEHGRSFFRQMQAPIIKHV